MFPFVLPNVLVLMSLVHFSVSRFLASPCFCNPFVLGGGKGRRKRPEKVVVRLSSGLSILGDSHRSERAGCVFSVFSTFKSRFGEIAIPERFPAFLVSNPRF